MNTDIPTLEAWQKSSLPVLREQSLLDSPLKNVTVLAYHFWDDERLDSRFYQIECAFLCAFRFIGKLPAVLVVNRSTERIAAFCRKYDIELQIDPSLTGGVKAMNIDCNRNLHRRFSTDYVLTVESDGFPLRAGLEEFVGPYDYVGAPWLPGGQPWYFRMFSEYRVGNSGFCLRSKAICEAASRFYNRYFWWTPYNFFTIEDVFYCKTMRWFNPFLRNRFSFPTPEQAAGFSVEFDRAGARAPSVGFHGEAGFRHYCEWFGVPTVEV